MAKADPKSTDAILGIAMCHHNTAEALAKLGRRAEALAESRRARTGYEAVVAASPAGAWVSGMLGSLYIQTADLEYSRIANPPAGSIARRWESSSRSPALTYAPKQRSCCSKRGTASTPAEAGPEFRIAAMIDEKNIAEAWAKRAAYELSISGVPKRKRPNKRPRSPFTAQRVVPSVRFFTRTGEFESLLSHQTTCVPARSQTVVMALSRPTGSMTT
jgi:hypothetical protein